MEPVPKWKALHNFLKLITTDTLLEPSRKLLQDAMAFFIDEELVWEQKKHCFIIAALFLCQMCLKTLRSET